MLTALPGSVRRVLLLLLVPLLLGTAYKWRDAEGQLHLTDAPPPPGIAYEVIDTPHGPPQPPVPSLPAQETRPTAPLSPAPGTDEQGIAARTAELDRRCVETLYQLDLLGMQLRVFRQGPGSARTYLDDRDRPAEVQRLARLRDEVCVGDEAALARQKRQADVLLQSLSPGCREDRERLEFMRRDPRTPHRDLEARETRTNQLCPDVAGSIGPDLWLADWILVR